MKLTLLIASGAGKPKEIPIGASPFLIGRDPACRLRPASALVSNRHCAVALRTGRAVVTDLGSTNGTFLNGQRIEGEHQLQDGDLLQVGPLNFMVHLETNPPVDQPTPLPALTPPAKGDDVETAAAVILFTDEDGKPLTPGAGTDSAGVPMGDTGLAIPPPPAKDADEKAKAKQPAQAGTGDTASAADAILKRYMRRPRKKP
jgi:pSer/pThr/pTyr-binding forkhead associated (FHA) protein